MPFSLSSVTTDSAGVAHLAAHGQATAVDFPVNNHVRFDALLGQEWATRRVLLDMEQVPYIDSSAIGWLISSQKQFRAAGGKLVLHSLQPSVRNVLELLKISRVVPIAADAAAGNAMLLEQAAAAGAH